MDLQEAINRLQGAAPAPGTATAPGTPGAPAAPVNIMQSPLFMPLAVGGLAYFATDKNWKWALGIAAAAMFLQKK